MPSTSAAGIGMLEKFFFFLNAQNLYFLWSSLFMLGYHEYRIQLIDIDKPWLFRRPFKNKNLLMKFAYLNLRKGSTFADPISV